jgi:hypothetical protein
MRGWACGEQHVARRWLPCTRATLAGGNHLMQAPDPGLHDTQRRCKAVGSRAKCFASAKHGAGLSCAHTTAVACSVQFMVGTFVQPSDSVTDLAAPAYGVWSAGVHELVQSAVKWLVSWSGGRPVLNHQGVQVPCCSQPCHVHTCVRTHPPLCSTTGPAFEGVHRLRCSHRCGVETMLLLVLRQQPGGALPRAGAGTSAWHLLRAVYTCAAVHYVAGYCWHEGPAAVTGLGEPEGPLSIEACLVGG